MLQPKKPVVKKTTTKKTKTVSQRLGDTTLRDVKNAGEDMLQLTTLGGYGKVKKALGGEYKYKKIGEKKYGGKITKAKNGSSLGMKSVKAGFDKNPGVTRADIITAAKGKAKNGKPVKKAALGALLPLAMKAAPMIAGMLGGKGKGKSGGIGGMLGGLMGKNGKTVKKAKAGATIKKAQTGTVQSANQQTNSNLSKIAMKNAGDSIKKSMAGNAKNGKSMKKCKYGCK
jgi:hypothetical protein